MNRKSTNVQGRKLLSICIITSRVQRSVAVARHYEGPCIYHILGTFYCKIWNETTSSKKALIFTFFVIVVVLRQKCYIIETFLIV